MTLFVVVVAIIAGYSDTNPWAWGTASEASLSTSSMTVLNAWLANLPQVFLSLWYITLNTFCTAMAGAEEWNNLAATKAAKGLRVTDPKGSQRSTYFLQLPYKFATPLITISTLLHWLLSQSFFIVRIDEYDVDGRLADSDLKSACGVSLSSLIVFCGISVGLLVIIWRFGALRMPVLLPPIRSSSLMISAACHPSIKEEQPHLKPVRWSSISEHERCGLAHYSLSSALNDIPATALPGLVTHRNIRRKPVATSRLPGDTTSTVLLNTGVEVSSS